MYIIIGADLVPTDRNRSLFENGDVEALVGERMKDVLDGASYRIFNLETPLTDVVSPIVKWGPNLIAPTNTCEGYKKLGVDLLTLANNHIMDQGVQGLRHTTETLDKASIRYVGTGDNVKTASAPFIFAFNDKKIGVYACAEHEFSVASEDSPGANPFDPLWSLDHVDELKKNTDYVIVLYHGGKEHYRYPSPMLQKTCRRFVDKGANLVICQHSHCIGCEEKYKGGTIVYGQGNFIFDDSDDDCWRTGLLVRVEDDFTVSYIPMVKSGCTVRMADDGMDARIMEGFLSRTEEIKKPGLIEEKYAQFAESFLDTYLRAFSGKRSLWFRVLNKLTKGNYMKRYLNRTYDKKTRVRLTNYLECEAHRELLLRGIKAKR